MTIKHLSFAALAGLLLTGAGCMTTSEPDIDLSDFEQDLTGITVEVSAPESVAIGETFTFGVEIQNASDERRSLRSIDIDRPALSGITITGTTPSLNREYYVESLDQDIFEFNAVIPANGKLDAEFTATADKAGAYVGDFDICIDNDVNCVFSNINLNIE